MTYDAFDTSRAQGGAVEIYLFTYGEGAGDYYAFTDGERTLTVDGIDYAPVPITRDKAARAGGREPKEMKISCDRANPVVGLFNVYPPDRAVSVVVKATHPEDPAQETRRVWSGVVVGVRGQQGGSREIACRSFGGATKRIGLRRHYQFGCPYRLYSAPCGASKAAATIPVVTVAATHTTVVLPAAWNGALNTSKYIRGTVEWTEGANTHSRTILRVAGDGVTLSLSGPTSGLATGGGDTLDVILGCSHKLTFDGPTLTADCHVLHNVINDFGGQGWIPPKNPVNTNPFT